jgi:ubiquinone biosynthesis accessory factor UbiJ
MIELPSVAALNHLLKGQPWARERLRPFAGRLILFRLTPMPDVGLRILDSGLVESGAKNSGADLTVTIKPAALPHLLARDESAMAQVELSGPVDLASTVQLLFRELTWDFEEDLSKVVGDVVAHRITGAARDFLAWQKDAASRLSQNFAEYLTEERPLLVPAVDITALRRTLETLNEDCEHLERRLEKVEARARRQRT